MSEGWKRDTGRANERHIPTMSSKGTKKRKAIREAVLRNFGSV